jgi:hypothetical protein
MAKKSLPQHAMDNRSRQLNPENDAYWQSRGQSGRPEQGSQPAPARSPSAPPSEPRPKSVK